MISTAQALHDEAMRLAEEADLHRAGGQADLARELFASAYEKERQAAELLDARHELEPTRSILFRSAASLALECGDKRSAVALVKRAFAGNPPIEIAEELQDLLGTTPRRLLPRCAMGIGNLVGGVLVGASLALIAWRLFGGTPTVQDSAEKVVSPPPIKVFLEATGYSQSVVEGTADGITASGLPVARGMAAADPTILPPGTVILVPGYGYALVGDVGSAIKGNRLDLFFPSRQEAFEWGRRMVVAQVVMSPKVGNAGAE